MKLVEFIMNKWMDEIKKIYASYGSGHDFDHIERVVENAKTINETEQADQRLVNILALIHDIFDEKFYKGNNMDEDYYTLIEPLELTTEESEQLLLDLKQFGFKGGFQQPKLSKIGQIVSDADRLDSIGAIGIARTMMYGDRLYDNNRAYSPPQSLSDYRVPRPILFHFYDKLLKIKDLMFTETGKQMAQARHEFMLVYLNQLQKETNLILPKEDSHE